MQMYNLHMYPKWGCPLWKPEQETGFEKWWLIKVHWSIGTRLIEAANYWRKETHNNCGNLDQRNTHEWGWQNNRKLKFVQLRGCRAIFETPEMLKAFSVRKDGDRERMRFGPGQVLFELAQRVCHWVPTVLIQRNLGLDLSRHVSFKGQFVSWWKGVGTVKKPPHDLEGRNEGRVFKYVSQEFIQISLNCNFPHRSSRMKCHE